MACPICALTDAAWWLVAGAALEVVSCGALVLLVKIRHADEDRADCEASERALAGPENQGTTIRWGGGAGDS